jgi:hypothetical protein
MTFYLPNEIIFIMLITMTNILILNIMYRAIDFKINKKIKSLVPIFITLVFLTMQSSKTYKFYVEKIQNI